MSINLLQGFHQAAHDYDGFIIDLWGVMHGGGNPFDWAMNSLRHLQRLNKKVIFLSNAPRRSQIVYDQLLAKGIDASLFQTVQTSGEEAWQNLQTRAAPCYQNLGRRGYHIGALKDADMERGLETTTSWVDTLEEADFILVTGPEHSAQTTEALQSLLDQALILGLPMICANPDLVVVRAGMREICAGAIADRYQAMGGDVRWHGKPYASVYHTAMANLCIDDPGKIAGIGDSLRTDVRGGNQAGIDTFWILGGVHMQPLGIQLGETAPIAKLQTELKTSDHKPKGILPIFHW